MKKRWYGRFTIIILLLFSILGSGFGIKEWQVEYEQKQVSTGKISNQLVIPGGMPIGIYMKTDGVLILGTDSIEGKDGKQHNPSKNVVKSGDYIIKINGEDVESKNDLIQEIEKLQDDDVVLGIRRNGEEITVKTAAVLCDKDEYKLGIWVRDSIQGLGTVTYITADNEFGALGHGIHDSDIDTLLEIEEGRVYNTEILRIQKGKKGEPGGLEGVIVYNKNNIIGSIEKNTDNGIYGSFKSSKTLDVSDELVPICTKSEVKKGAAVIRCCVDGKVKEYDIEISRINHFTFEENKGMVIKIVDEELLEMTGGIV